MTSYIADCRSVVTISAGLSHGVSLMDDGTVWAWGYNADGELGDGTAIDRPTPVQVPISDVKAISARGAYTLILKNDGTVWACGSNSYGQLGDGNFDDSTVPVQVLIDNVTDIIAGYNHNFAFKNDGTVWAWGKNDYGQLGDGTVNNNSPQGKSVPVQVQITDVKEISPGGDYSLALKNDGSVWMWGHKNNGDIGNGGDEYYTTPIRINLNNITAISAGLDISMAIMDNGTLWAWGNNQNGLVGDDTINLSPPFNKDEPTIVRGLTNIISVSIGSQHALALKSDGTVWGWGSNYAYALASEQPNQVSHPIQISSLSSIKAISAGNWHSYAITNNGIVLAWGVNTNGELGDGTISDPKVNMGAVLNPEKTLLDLTPSVQSSSTIAVTFNPTITPVASLKTSSIPSVTP